MSDSSRRGRSAWLVLAAVLCAALLFLWWILPGVVAARKAARPLFLGSPEAPIVGLRLGDEPEVLYRELTRKADPPVRGQRLPREERATFSRDWTQVVVHRIEEGLTRARTQEGFEFELDGPQHLSLDGVGRTLVANELAPRDPRERVVRILGPAGQELAALRVDGLRWVSLSRDGERIGLGTPQAVRILRRSGDDAWPALAGASVAGELSADGSWLALQRAQSLELHALRGQPSQGSVGSFAVEPGLALRFDGRSKWLAHLSEATARVFSIGPGPLVPEMSVSAAPLTEWRGAAFAPDGRLVLSYLRVERVPRSEPGDLENPLRPGLAHAGIQVFEPPSQVPMFTKEWTVEDWNQASPEIAFDRKGRLYAIVWPSAFEILLP